MPVPLHVVDGRLVNHESLFAEKWLLSSDYSSVKRLVVAVSYCFASFNATSDASCNIKPSIPYAVVHIRLGSVLHTGTVSAKKILGSALISKKKS